MIAPFGVLVAAMGAATLLVPLRWALALILLATPFGAAVAIAPPGLGGAAILVPSLALGFYGLRVLMALGPGPMLSGLLLHPAGICLLALTGYGILAAYFSPRLLAGATDTLTMTRLEGYTLLRLTPLRPQTMHITQSFYALGSLVAFAATFAVFRLPGVGKSFLSMMLALCVLNILLAMIDLATWITGTTWLLEPVRSANYTMLTEVDKAGLKRLTGSFSEASAFAAFTAILFAFVASLWLDRPSRSLTAGVIALVLLVLLLVSTSATAYVCLGLTFAFLTARHVASTGGWAGAVAMGMIGLIGCVAILVILLAFPEVARTLSFFFDDTLLSKVESSSGRERSSWNAIAWQNFVETWGLGTGIGGARASSYLLVLLSNVGVFGLICFLAFVGLVLLTPTPKRLDEVDRSIVRASRAALFTALVAATTIATVYEMPAIFYMLAAAVAALTAPERIVLRRQIASIRPEGETAPGTGAA
jgi:hypothetical protein